MCDDADLGSCKTAEADDVLLRIGRMSPLLLQRISRATARRSSKASEASCHAPTSAPRESSPTAQRTGSTHAFVCGPPSMTECASHVT